MYLSMSTITSTTIVVEYFLSHVLFFWSDVTAPVVQCPLNKVIFADEGQNMASVPWTWEPVMVSLFCSKSNVLQQKVRFVNFVLYEYLLRIHRSKVIDL